MAGIEDELPPDKTLLTLSGRHRSLEKSLNLIRQGIIDGLVIKVYRVSYRWLKRKIIPALEKINIPFVVVHPTGEELGYPSVGINLNGAGYLITDHLLKKGITDIRSVTIDTHRYAGSAVREGVAAAFNEHGKSFTDKDVIHLTIPDHPGQSEPMLLKQ